MVCELSCRALQCAVAIRARRDKGLARRHRCAACRRRRRGTKRPADQSRTTGRGFVASRQEGRAAGFPPPHGWRGRAARSTGRIAPCGVRPRFGFAAETRAHPWSDWRSRRRPRTDNTRIADAGDQDRRRLRAQRHLRCHLSDRGAPPQRRQRHDLSRIRGRYLHRLWRMPARMPEQGTESLGARRRLDSERTDYAHRASFGHVRRLRRQLRTNGRRRIVRALR